MASQRSGTDKPQDAFIDESGWTSVEPEGAGKHPHRVEDYPDTASKERWENDLGGEPGGAESAEASGLTGDEGRDAREGQEAHARGPRPVEGDGDGAPL